jgi:HEAT repeat protein
VKTAAAMRQVVLRPGQMWTAAEQEPTGEYEAQYTRGPGPLALGKRRTRYTRLSTARGLRPTADVGTAEVSDVTTIVLTAEDELDRLDTRVQTTVRPGDGLPTVAGKLHGSFVLHDRGADASKVGDFERRRAALDRVEMITKPDVSVTAEAWREADRQAVGTRTLTDLAASLAQVPVEDKRARAEAMATLRADFRLRPEDASRAAALVATAAVDDGKAITAALGGVGSPEAQRALVAIVDNPGVPLPVRLNASTAILLLEQPDPAVVTDLQRQMNDPNEHIRGAAALALGSVIQRLATEHPAEHDAALGALVASLQTAPTATERVTALRALGNSGDARVTPLASQAYSDQSVAVRIAAVHAVRFVPGAEADALITRAMLADPDPRVRVQAVDTATAHRFVPTYFPAYEAILGGDNFPLVRRAVARSLATSSGLHQAAALLQRAAQDPSQDVRAVAMAALQNATAASP